MATRTLGSNANNSLTAVLASRTMAAADIASVANGIKDDIINGNPIFPGAFSSMNMLYVPNRGILQVLPGDYVAFDSTGWPILISANAILSGPWTHS